MFAAADVVALTLYAAAYTVQSLVTRKLGVRRWLNYNEALWKAALPLDLTAAAVSALILFAAAAAAFRFIRLSASRSGGFFRRSIFAVNSKSGLWAASAAMLSAVFCVCFTAMYSAETVRALLNASALLAGRSRLHDKGGDYNAELT